MAIPPSTAPFFQEYNFDQLDPLIHRHLVIERILAYGNREELRWLVQNYGWQTIQTWIAQSGHMRLPMSRYHLWCLVFEVPEVQRPQGIWKL